MGLKTNECNHMITKYLPHEKNGIRQLLSESDIHLHLVINLVSIKKPGNIKKRKFSKQDKSKSIIITMLLDQRHKQEWPYVLLLSAWKEKVALKINFRKHH